ncbi:MAG TPA: NAD(P)H-dependent oxidoreductase [Verrucomicrobiae bacterium]|nr:NAD(P)H-dependent oxidoreductase [Verrucomicrobiae bacterium]
MSTSKNEQVLQALRWRYATKHFDSSGKIPADIWHTIEQSLVLTPTSYGLQPYRFLLINDPAKRTELVAHSWHQKQVVDASHFVVFTARTHMAEADVDKLISRISEVRQVPAESLKGYRHMMISDVIHGERGKIAHEWAIRQTYIALGNVMTCAALLGVDACPMEGLNPNEYDRILDLKDTGYRTVVACAFGYRSGADKYASATKVRYETADLIRVI